MTSVLQEVESQLRELGSPFGWPKWGPTVKAMAEAAGRTEEYRFFYVATSRSVHSNLHEMARMVWGDAQSMTMTITSQTLAVLHSEFSLTYGVWFYGEVLRELSAPLPRLGELVASPPWPLLHALVLGGVARNGRLPPIVSERELAWPSDL